MNMIRFFACLLLVAFPAILVAAEPVMPRVLLLNQKPDGHPAGAHEYVQGLKILAGDLQKAGIATVIELADEPWDRGPEFLEGNAGVVLFLAEGGKWLSAHPARLAAFQAHANRKGGLVCLHWAMGSRQAEPVENFANLFGACHGGPDRRYKDLTTEIHFAAPEHPILKGLDSFPVKRIRDEFYFALKRPQEQTGFVPLWQITIADEPQTVGWAWSRPDGGRSFGFSGLHYHANWENETYRKFVLRGVLWSISKDVGE